MAANPVNVAVIMAGGSGTRFWPSSRPEKPKQFLALTSNRSLIFETVERFTAVSPRENIFICSALSQKALLENEFGASKNFILEPTGRNTAACLMLSVLELLRGGYPAETRMVAAPADHAIANTKAFTASLEAAFETASGTHGIVTLGIKPTSPHTGYGYIETEELNGKASAVRRFLEKPKLEVAKEIYLNPRYFWNAGIFVAELGTFRTAFEKFLPKEWGALNSYRSPGDLEKVYKSLNPVSVDVAVMEKAGNMFLVPASFDWSDIGSWNALYELRAKGKDDSVQLDGQSTLIQSSGCLVSAPPGKKIALVGVKDLVVIDTGDTLLVLNRKDDQLVREAVRRLEPSS